MKKKNHSPKKMNYKLSLLICNLSLILKFGPRNVLQISARNYFNKRKHMLDRRQYLRWYCYNTAHAVPLSALAFLVELRVVVQLGAVRNPTPTGLGHTEIDGRV